VGKLMNLFCITGSVHDRQAVRAATAGLEGLLVGDAGYLEREAVFRERYEQHRHSMSAARKNMKRVMSQEQKRLWEERSRIERIWDVMKDVV
jgi:hypothetical protein